MFEQHPVPQQISSYQFRLVGDMTIKQFFQIAGGAVIALVFYALPLPSFLRWPLVISSLILGAAFAFLPIQERPMEEWIAAFFRSIYSPTIFFWDPDVTKQKYFATENATTTAPVQQADTTVNPTVAATSEDKSIAALEHAEQSALSKLTGLFSHKASPAQATQATSISAAVPPSPNMQMQTTPVDVSETPKVEVAIPAQAAPEVKTSGYIMPVTGTIVSQEVKQEPVPQTLNENIVENAQTAQFSADAAPPMVPEYPNLVTGQVMTSDKHIVEGAILEIKDSEGRSVRALKTNKAGHFFIVTPLAEGEYQIEIEKEGLTFNPVNISIKGEIMPPIAITANNGS